MARLHLSLLGGFEAEFNGLPLTISRNKAKGLLAYLAMPTGKARSREELCALLWSRTGDAQARDSLRQALFVLRKSLPETMSPVAQGDDLYLQPDQIGCDAIEFEAASNGASISDLETAFVLYRGPLLQGLSLREEEFDRWLAAERARHEGIAIFVMTRLLRHYLSVCRHNEAINVAHRALGIDPLQEDAHRALILAYNATGYPGLAQDQFEKCRRLLACELGVMPAEETQKAFHEISKTHSQPAKSVGPPKPQSASQVVRFCRAFDGTKIAFATAGTGPPLVKAPNWMTHLEYEWESPVWRHYLSELSREHTFIRFDQRANGLSDWNVDDISFEAFVRDLEAVADRLSLDRFSLLGISQGCPISIAYAVRHPERVSKLILAGGFVMGAAKRDDESREKSDAINTLIRHGWGEERSGLRAMYTANLIPGGTKEQMDWYTELMRVSASPKNALRLRTAMSLMDVSELLPLVQAPTLVLHARNDAVAPFEEGRALAARIPNARFVALDSNNHILLESEPAWPRFVKEVQTFLEMPDC